MNTTALMFTTVMYIFGVSGWIVAVSAIRSWGLERKKPVKWWEVFR